MRKPTIYICENKDADQLCSNCIADQRLCFRHSDSTVSLLLISKLSSFLLYSVTVQTDLYQTWWEPQIVCFLMHRLISLADFTFELYQLRYTVKEKAKLYQTDLLHFTAHKSHSLLLACKCGG